MAQGMEAPFPQTEGPKREGEEWECVLKRKPQSIYNQSFLHILFVRSDLVSPTHIQGKGITHGHKYQEVAYHEILTIFGELESPW